MEAAETNTLSAAAAALGRKGGVARAKKLSAQERKRIATLGSRAAAKARTKRARERRQSAAWKNPV